MDALVDKDGTGGFYVGGSRLLIWLVADHTWRVQDQLVGDRPLTAGPGALARG